MSEPETVPLEFRRAIESRLGTSQKFEDLVPPVFTEMRGEILDYEPRTQTLTVRIPTDQRYHNPYGVMQGGMIAAAIDNAIGPLSVAAAPPNLTRELTVKYKKTVSPEYLFVIVKAWVEKLDPPYLYLAARVESESGELFARAKARHYILPQS